MVPVTPSQLDALCGCAFVLSPSPLSHLLQRHTRVTSEAHDENAPPNICFGCYSIKARILAYSTFSLFLLQGPKSGRLLAVIGCQDLQSHRCATTMDTQQCFLRPDCQGSVPVSCREGRGAGPLAVSGFQDLKSHSVWYEYGHKALALGALYIINKGLALACRRAGITFPSPLIGQPISARLQDKAHCVVLGGDLVILPHLLVPSACITVHWLLLAFTAIVWPVVTTHCLLIP